MTRLKTALVALALGTGCALSFAQGTAVPDNAPADATPAKPMVKKHQKHYKAAHHAVKAAHRKADAAAPAK